MVRNRHALLVAFALAVLTLLGAALPAAADGIIIPQPPVDRPTLPWRDIPISVKYHRVDVTIAGQVATTHVDQVFVNDNRFPVEGTYIFPLPEDAAISSFDMTVDGQKYEGKLLGRDEARAIYEDIVRQQRDPALLEYVGRGAFQARIFPIPAGAERRIELTYAQVLNQQNGLVHYRYPLNTEKFSARPLQEVAVTVRVEDPAPLRAIYSPSHPVQVTRDGDRRATVSYEARDTLPDRDFDLYYSLSQDAIAVNLLSNRPAGEDGFFLLLVTPPIKSDEKPVAKDVVLVLDTSGSMDGKKIDQARAAAGYVLDHLGEEDRFNIIAFSTSPRLFASSPQPLSRRADGRAFIQTFRAEGSTDINRALLEAVAGASRERPTILIFLTDGVPTVGETNPDRIVSNVTQNAPKSVRLFAFGVGFDLDAVLLDQLSSSLRGASAYVKPDQSIDEAVSAFYAQVSAPVLVDVNVDVSGAEVEDVYPYPLPDLFAGNQLVVAGRYRQGGPVTLKLSGTVNGQPRSFTYSDLQVADRGGNEFIPRLWAQRKIAYLLAQIRLHGSKDELVKEVVDLSTRFGIVTPYTSFLVQEPQQVLTDEGRRQLTQSLQQPQMPGAQPTTAPAAGGSFGRGGGTGGQAPSGPAAAPAAEAPLAPQDRTGEQAVQRAETEKQLANQGYASAAAAPDQVRQIGNKAFVFHDDAWTDTTFDQTRMQAEAITFGSDRYFQLLAQHPDIAPYLALGARVTIVLDGRAFAIGPAGATAAQPTPPAGQVAPPAAQPTPAAGPDSSMGSGQAQPAGTAQPVAIAPGATPEAVAALPDNAQPVASQPGVAVNTPALCSGSGAALLLGLAGVGLALARRRHNV